MTLRRLTDLPDEIARSICFLVEWNDALSLQATCRRFADVANEHLLWKYYCRSSFRYWAASHQISIKLADASFQDWKQLFKKRYEAESKTQSALQDIICNQKARTPKIEIIVGLEYDSKDVLLWNFAEASDSDDHLARKYVFLFYMPGSPN
jgi:F-box protein 21